MAAICQEKREINNHQQIKKTVNATGKSLFDIITHPTENKLAAKIYRPESVIMKGKRSLITDKICVTSAKNDRLKSMKQLLKSAALKQGMTEKTSITILADDARNCWEASQVFISICKNAEYILDWFHIAKKFQPLLSNTSIKHPK